jgi:hypothetical protein
MPSCMAKSDFFSRSIAIPIEVTPLVKNTLQNDFKNKKESLYFNESKLYAKFYFSKYLKE